MGLLSDNMNQRTELLKAAMCLLSACSGCAVSVCVLGVDECSLSFMFLVGLWMIDVVVCRLLLVTITVVTTTLIIDVFYTQNQQL